MSKDYISQVLTPFVSPLFYGDPGTGWEGLSSGSEFIEDAAPPHGTKGLQVKKEELNIPVHLRPPNSPDLNPIEHCWRYIKAKIQAYQKYPENLADLQVAVTAEWEKMPLEYINSLILSMPHRLQAVIDHRGAATEF